MLENYKDVLVIEDLMEIFSLGRNSAYQLLHTDKIRYVKIGQKIRIPKICVIEYINNI